MNRIIIIALLFILTISCTSLDNKTKAEINYIGDKNYIIDSIPDLRDSTIVLKFVSQFQRDSVHISTFDKKEKLLLSTNEITGSAGLFEFGKITNQKEITLRINNLKPISFIANQKNQIFLISYSPNSRIQIKSVFHLPSDK